MRRAELMSTLSTVNSKKGLKRIVLEKCKQKIVFMLKLDRLLGIIASDESPYCCCSSILCSKNSWFVQKKTHTLHFSCGKSFGVRFVAIYVELT